MKVQVIEPPDRCAVCGALDPATWQASTGCRPGCIGNAGAQILATLKRIEDALGLLHPTVRRWSE